MQFMIQKSLGASYEKLFLVGEFERIFVVATFVDQLDSKKSNRMSFCYC